MQQTFKKIFKNFPQVSRFIENILNFDTHQKCGDLIIKIFYPCKYLIYVKYGKVSFYCVVFFFFLVMCFSRIGRRIYFSNIICFICFHRNISRILIISVGETGYFLLVILLYLHRCFFVQYFVIIVVIYHKKSFTYCTL